MARKKQHWARALSDAMNLATTVAASVAVGYLGGKWLDGKFDTTPWLAVVGFLLGVATSMKVMWERSMKDSSKSAFDEKNNEGN